jgi:hypothetical protein
MMPEQCCSLICSQILTAKDSVTVAQTPTNIVSLGILINYYFDKSYGEKNILVYVASLCITIFRNKPQD